MTDNVRNQLLRSLSAPDFAVVRPLLRRVDLPRNMQLDEPGCKIENVYFLETGICSIVVVGENNQRTEAGHIGREGMSGALLATEADWSPNETLMQVVGRGFQMSSNDFVECLAECASLRRAALRYSRSLYVQVSHTLLSTARYTIHQRLARWLLMCHDRVDGDDLELTHDFLAMMLTVRRSGVTTELHILEGMRLIKATRGLVRVLDRKGLIEVASGSYGIAEREYARLFPATEEQGRESVSQHEANRSL